MVRPLDDNIKNLGSWLYSRTSFYLIFNEIEFYIFVRYTISAKRNELKG